MWRALESIFNYQLLQFYRSMASNFRIFKWSTTSGLCTNWKCIRHCTHLWLYLSIDRDVLVCPKSSLIFGSRLLFDSVYWVWCHVTRLTPVVHMQKKKFKKRKVRTRSSFCLIWVMRFGAVGTESKTMCSYSVVALFWNLNLSPSVVPIAELLLLEAGISIISYSHAWRTGLYSSCQISARAVTSWWAQLLVSNLLVTDSSQRHTPTTFIYVPIRVG